jgi:LCP family protein required for cell wall assembly
MTRKSFLWAAAILLAVILSVSALVIVRVHGALENLTGRAHSIWDSVEFVLPNARPPAKLAPSPSTLPFVAVSDFDPETLREDDTLELTEAMPEYQPEPTTEAAPQAADRDSSDEAISIEDGSGRINFLLVGIYGADYAKGGLLTDAILVASLDHETGRAAMISIPRDLYVQIPEVGGHWKINAAYAIGERRFGRGLELAMETVSRTVGIPIHYGVRIDLSGLEILVDALGGLDVHVQRDFAGGEHEPIAVQKGVRHMDSESVLLYVQSRKTTNDFDRSRRQREVLMAIKDRLSSMNNPLVLLDTLDITSRHVRTTLTSQEIKTLLYRYAGTDFENLVETGFDTSPAGLLQSMRSERGEYILVPRSGSFSEIRAVVRNVFDSSGSRGSGSRAGSARNVRSSPSTSSSTRTRSSTRSTPGTGRACSPGSR